MKKPLFFALLTVLFCALFAVSLAACSDDKAPEPAPNAPNLESPEQDNGNPDNPEPPDTNISNPESPEQDAGNPDAPEPPDTNITYAITAQYPDGNPVVGIKFALYDGNEEHNASAVTDAEGKETFSLPPKKYSIKLADYGTVNRSTFSFDDNKYFVTPQKPSVTVELDRITPPSITTNTVEAKETSAEKFAARYDVSPFEFLPQNAKIVKEGGVYTYNGDTVLVAVAGETFIPKGTGKSLDTLAEENSEDFIFDAGENTKNDYSKFIAAYAACCNEDGLHVLTDEMKNLLDLYAAAKGLDPLFACGVYAADNPDLTTGEGSESSPYPISAGTYSVKISAGRTLYFSAEELLMITSGDDRVTITHEEKTYTAGEIEGDIEFDCEEDSTFTVTVTDGSEATITFTAVEIKVKDSRNTFNDQDHSEENDKKKTYSAGSPEELVGEYGVYINNDNFRIKFKNTTGASINIKITRKTEDVNICTSLDELPEDEMPEDSNVLEFTLEADIECWIDIETSENLFARFSIEIVETQE